ncbi:MAG: class I SAM-dependent methyltransferase [Patescibacteria group bacterium]
MNNFSDYWDHKHVNYGHEDWIVKPSLFAMWAMTYFPTDGKVLDLGAGQGQDSRYFASNGYKVTSTDFSDTALENNRQKITPDIVDKMTIEEIDLSKPFKYEDSSFDVVYSHLATHYFTGEVTKQLFSEMHRVLKQGGVLALLTNSTTDPQYGTGEKIEEDYFEIEGINKRYFSVESIQKFTSLFETVVIDDKGETYKDRAANINNLIRFIGRKK